MFGKAQYHLGSPAGKSLLLSVHCEAKPFLVNISTTALKLTSMTSKQEQREAEIALHYAMRNLPVDEVKQLLAAGVDPNAPDLKSRNFRLAFTALCTAIETAAHTISETRAMVAEAGRELSRIHIVRILEPYEDSQVAC